MKGVAETGCGPVQGSAVDGGRAWAWRGIPYAAPPIGPRRFRAPGPAPAWAARRDGSRPAASPMQSASSPFAGGLPANTVGEVSEDCLTLDVWAPADRSERRPVLVWIPGGAFLTGGSAVATYDGTRLAVEHGLVVVSVNYRLGAFGFLWVDGGDANCGLADQLAALRWVRAHVAAFGGDPANVTVAGESAGAGSVLHLLPAAAGQGLVARAIVQSAGVDHTQLPEHAERVKAAVMAEAGVTVDADLWHLPAAALLDAQERALPALMGSVGALPFHPVVDGSLVADRPGDRWPVAGVDLLVGWTAEEMRLYPDRGADDPAGLGRRLGSLVRRRSGARPADTVIDDLVEFYRPAGSGDDIWAAAQTDILMRLPARRLALSVEGPAVHLAQFDWGATGGDWRRGAFHAIDLPFTFATLDVGGWLEFLGAAGPDDRGAAAVASRWMQAWAGFARSGDPGWAPAPAVMRFDVESGPGPDPLVEAAELWRRAAPGWPPI